MKMTPYYCYNCGVLLGSANPPIFGIRYCSDCRNKLYPVGDTKPMILDKVIVELVPDGSGMLVVNAAIVYGKWANTSLEIIPESPLINPTIGNAVTHIRNSIHRQLDYKIGIPEALYNNPELP